MHIGYSCQRERSTRVKTREQQWGSNNNCHSLQMTQKSLGQIVESMLLQFCHRLRGQEFFVRRTPKETQEIKLVLSQLQKVCTQGMLCNTMHLNDWKKKDNGILNSYDGPRQNTPPTHNENKWREEIEIWIKFNELDQQIFARIRQGNTEYLQETSVKNIKNKKDVVLPYVKRVMLPEYIFATVMMRNTQRAVFTCLRNKSRRRARKLW